MTSRAPQPCWATKPSACRGSRAAITVGSCATCTAPNEASVANQRSITGPKTRPTRVVPPRWMVNSSTSAATVRGTTNGPKAGAATVRPSMAETTEMAGVTIPSP